MNILEDLNRGEMISSLLNCLNRIGNLGLLRFRKNSITNIVIKPKSYRKISI